MMIRYLAFAAIVSSVMIGAVIYLFLLPGKQVVGEAGLNTQPLHDTEGNPAATAAAVDTSESIFSAPNDPVVAMLEPLPKFEFADSSIDAALLEAPPTFELRAGGTVAGEGGNNGNAKQRGSFASGIGMGTTGERGSAGSHSAMGASGASRSRVQSQLSARLRTPAEAPPDSNNVDSAVREQHEPSNTNAFDHVKDNEFLRVQDNPLSTFSADVDTGSYSILRGFITQQRRLPPPGAVRIEELLNYFHYDYAPPKDNTPFAVHTEVAGCPWNPQHRLLKIGLKGKEIPKDQRPASNLVFLIDVSGSMSPLNRLPLVKDGLKAMVNELSEKDAVAIVVYAGSSGLVLPSTSGDVAGKRKILGALEQLHAGGSTNGAQGIQLAYETASQSFIKGGSNRVILASDGDFNVGVTSQDELIRLIEAKAKSGVFLTCLGVGYGNLKDSTLEKLADKGNGNYAYLDDLLEAKKVLVDEMSGTLHTIAKDVKLQLEFNPSMVASYRLIGYENRVLAKEDFNNDKKDAGDIGAGHTVTALYEIVPASVDANPGPEGEAPAVDPLKYQAKGNLTPAAANGELLTLKLRYKQPDGDKSALLEFTVKDAGNRYGQASPDFKFASAVAAYGMLLRDSPHKGTATMDAVLELAGEGLDQDEGGYRHEFVELVRQSKALRR